MKRTTVYNTGPRIRQTHLSANMHEVEPPDDDKMISHPFPKNPLPERQFADDDGDEMLMPHGWTPKEEAPDGDEMMLPPGVDDEPKTEH